MTSCMICGLKLYHFEANEDSSQWRQDLSERAWWWGDVRLLCDPDDEVGTLCPSLSYPNMRKPCTITLREARTQGFRSRSEASDIEIYPGQYQDRGKYVALDPDGTARGHVCLFPKTRAVDRTYDNRHYIPVHNVCLQMAQKLWGEAPENAFIRDIRGLCIALTWRLALGVKCLDPQNEYPPNYVVGRYNFYHRWDSWRLRWNGPKPFALTNALPGPAENPNDNIPDLYGTNPLEIEGLTESLLLSLEETPCHRTNDLERRLFDLPRELVSMILDTIDFRDLPRITTGFLSQSVWLHKLKSGCLPWLWDLDLACIDAKCKEPCPSGETYEWNWELLVRQLSRGVDFGVGADVPPGTHPELPLEESGQVVQTDDTFWVTTGYHNDLQYVPPGLFNRRRIWQLLEEVFVGDFIPETVHDDPYFHNGPKFVIEDYIQLPWSKSGHVLESPKWMPSFALFSYVRRIDGEVYIIDRSFPPMQYWQDPGGYWKHNVVMRGIDPDLKGPLRPPKGAKAKYINKVLRRLGYPV